MISFVVQKSFLFESGKDVETDKRIGSGLCCWGRWGFVRAGGYCDAKDERGFCCKGAGGGGFIRYELLGRI